MFSGGESREAITMPDHDALDFEEALKEFVLIAFANGEDIEGEFELESIPDSIPDWEVDIRKVDKSGEEMEFEVHVEN